MFPSSPTRHQLRSPELSYEFPNLKKWGSHRPLTGLCHSFTGFAVLSPVFILFSPSPHPLREPPPKGSQGVLQPTPMWVIHTPYTPPTKVTDHFHMPQTNGQYSVFTQLSAGKSLLNYVHGFWPILSPSQPLRVVTTAVPDNTCQHIPWISFPPPTAGLHTAASDGQDEGLGTCPHL